MLIVFEGGEGSGKGTQISLLTNYLINKGKKVLNIIEPGGTKVGHAIRDILLNRSDFEIDGLTEALLFSASRAYQVQNVTIPALQRGNIVLSDRSFYSTYAYQGHARENDLELLQTLTKIAVNKLHPDLVIYLDIDPKIGITRKKDQNEINRLDKEDISFHNKVRKGYLTLAKNESHLWNIIDAGKSIDDVHKNIISVIDKVLVWILFRNLLVLLVLIFLIKFYNGVNS